MKKVFIIDSNYPEDHFGDRADGVTALHILKALGIKADLRLALDREHFRLAVARALRARCDVLHVSTHGDAEGIAICNDVRGSGQGEGFLWNEFAALFQGQHQAPTALVMSACNGASTGLAESFTSANSRPKLIIGSTDKRYSADYVAAWALLYRHFKTSGLDRAGAQGALKAICASVHRKFVYWRWDDERRRYLRYPGSGTRFDIVERE